LDGPGPVFFFGWGPVVSFHRRQNTQNSKL
jgi:hypothetical protein